MKTSQPKTKEERYDALMGEVREAHRERVASEEPSDARWTALAAAAREAAAGKRAPTRAWIRPALAFCAVALAVGVVLAYDAGLERGAGPSVAEALPTNGPGLWHSGEAPLTLTFAGGHTAQLAADTILDVADATPSLFDARVTRGAVTFEVSPRRPDDIFRVRFGAEYLEVRGTKFTVSLNDNGEGAAASVSVEHGVVEVFAGGGSELIRASQAWPSPPVGAAIERLGNDEAAASLEVEVVAVGDIQDAEPQDEPADGEKASAEAEAAAAEKLVPEQAVAPPKTTPSAKLRAVEANPTVKSKSRLTTEIVEIAPQQSPIVGVEPLSATVEHALLLSMKSGDCAGVERALAGVIRAQGAAAPGEAWWMRAWCARSRGDGPTSVRYFEKARGKARWAIPDAATLPPVPQL